MSNRRDIQLTFSPHNKATILDCNFTVDQANGNGKGIRSLKQSGRIGTVHMNSSASFTGTTHTGTAVLDGISGGTASLVVGMQVQTTDLPAGTTILSITSSSAVLLSQAATTGHAGATITVQSPNNPQPSAGVIVVTLQDNYNTYLGGTAGFASPLSGSTITSGMTVGATYVLVTLGSSTLTQMQTAGVPKNVTPAVGVSFIAAATSIAGGAAVQAVATAGSGIDHIEVLGDSNLMNSNGTYVTSGVNGMTIILLCFKNGVLTQPADNTVIGLQFLMNNSAQGV